MQIPHNDKMVYCENSSESVNGDGNSSRLYLEEKLRILELAKKCKHINRFILSHLPTDWFHNLFFSYMYCSDFWNQYFFVCVRYEQTWAKEFNSVQIKMSYIIKYCEDEPQYIG